MNQGPENPIFDPFPVTDEKELFKKQYLKMRSGYESVIKQLSLIKELVNILRLTGIYDGEMLFLEQLKIIKKYLTMGHVSLLLINDESRMLEVIASLHDLEWLTMPEYHRLTQETAKQALIQNNAVIVNNIQESCFPEETKRQDGNCLISVPLVRNGQAIGVLNLVPLSVNTVDKNQLSLFSLVADQLVTSVTLSRLYSQMIKEENKRFLLSRFFSKNVTKEILESKGILRRGGVRKQATIMFADLRGFTSISEKLDQEEVVDILNLFFTQIIPIIFGNDGTLDKLLGDGIMAVFGAPISHDHDPMHAVRTAIQIIQELHHLNESNRPKGWPELRIGIGINTGEVVAGYIGSEDHINYTVIGDAVNTAQRIESIAGADEILVSKAVKDAIDELHMEVPGLNTFTELPPQKVKGKKEPIAIFRVEY
jgi:class 3 adenylate cyclase